jgi:hypothetical protein
MTEIGLTNEDKIGVITSHMKNLHFNKYNAEITIIEENALANPSASTIARANSTIADAELQIAALEAQITALAE